MEDGVWVWVIVEAIGGEFWGGGRPLGGCVLERGTGREMDGLELTP